MPQEEDQYWSDQIQDARRTQLETVRKASAAWAGLFTAVLGVFGSVTFATGFATLSELPPQTRALVRAVIASAAVCTLAATILSGLASNSRPRVSDDLSVDNFRVGMKRRAKQALLQLRVAIWLGAVAAALVVLGSLVVLYSGRITHPSVQPIMVVIHGQVYCGTPTMGDAGTLRLGSLALRNVVSLLVVPACPGAR
jgi:uncharacterized membrane protein YfcA